MWGLHRSRGREWVGQQVPLWKPGGNKAQVVGGVSDYGGGALCTRKSLDSIPKAAGELLQVLGPRMAWLE